LNEDSFEVALFLKVGVEGHSANLI